MAISYTWKIVTCEHEVATGGITLAHWDCVAVDGEVNARIYGVAAFTPDASAPGFTPYDQVTEAQVLGWCWAGDVDQAATEAQLAQRIEDLKNPVAAAGTPW